MPYLMVTPISLLIFAFGLHVASHQIKNKKYSDIALAALNSDSSDIDYSCCYEYK